MVDPVVVEDAHAAGDGSRIVVVMGVAGSGKSTVGSLLAQRLGVAFVEGDDFHDRQDLAAMAAGRALKDTDRIPWLDRLNRALSALAGDGAVCACSALTPAARNRLTSGLRGVRMVWLRGDPALVAQRLGNRRHHPVGAALLPSQFDALVPPDAAIEVDITTSADEIVDRLVVALKM